MRATLEDWALFILRAGAGITFIVHGWPKLFPAGPLAFSRYLHAHHFPAPLFFAWVFALVEVFGGLALLAGVQPKWTGVALGVERVITAVRLKMVGGVGFVAARGTGWELDFLLLCMAVAVAILGAGAITLATFVPMLRTRRIT
jgi:uncharacterized membrane protein YphA (DoxX/SURF4 family)